MTARIIIELYQVPAKRGDGRPTRRPQRWRWRAVSEGNHKILAVSSEAYTNEKDAESAIHLLFGAETNIVLRRADSVDLALVVAP